MRDYPLYILAGTPDEYEAKETGTIRAAVYVNDRQKTDSPYYAEASYVALTWRQDITDRHLIKLDNGLKKVVHPLPGRMTRLLLTDWG